MSQLTDNLNAIASIKSDIAAAIESKGVSMTGVPFGSYADKIGEIQTGGSFVTEPLNVTDNGVYTPGQGVDGYSQVTVNVPQSVTGYTEKDLTEGQISIVNLSNSASFVASVAFANNNNVRTVYLSNCSLVNDYAFQNCYNLQTVDLPNCTTIKGSAFSYCDSMTEISIPNCEVVSNDTFVDCHKLQGIDLSKVSYLGNGTLARCYSLSTVNVPNVLECGDATFTFDSNLQNIDLPLCSMLGNYTFSHCSNLTSINLPNLYRTGNYVFYNCPKLSEINLSNILSLGYYACFCDCSSLEKLTLNLNNYTYQSYGYDWLNGTKIASGTGSIYVQSWYYDRYISADGWSSLSARFVSVPVSSMLSFSDGLLSGYTQVIDYSFNSYLGRAYSEIISVSLPNCSYIEPRPYVTPDQNPFRNECSNLKTLNLPLLSSCPYEFMRGHSNIQEVIIPNCNRITAWAFGSCYSLSEIYLQKCSKIDEYVFYGCSTLNKITLGYSSVCELDHDVFHFTPISSGTGFIYVPSSLVDAYKSANNWSRFSSRIFPIPE